MTTTKAFTTMDEASCRHPAPRLAPDLVRAIVPAYLFPLATSLPGALVTGDPALLAASTTTIPIPGAIAAGVVVLVTRWLARRLSPARQVHRWRACAIGLVACGALAVVAALVLVRAGVLAQRDLKFVLPGPPVAGAITAFLWAKRRAVAQTLGGALVLSVVALVATGCTTPWPRISRSWPHALAQPELHGGGPRVAVFGAVVAACEGWAAGADDAAAVARASEGRFGRVAAIAGVLGTASGIATAVVAATASNTSDQARAGQIGGSAALGFGLVAGVTQMIASGRSNRAAEAMTVAATLEHAATAGTEAVLVAPEPEREAVASARAPALLVECANAARTLGSLARLPLASPRAPEVDRAVEVLRAAHGTGEAELTRAVHDALFGDGAP